jgi:hypothetical protein
MLMLILQELAQEPTVQLAAGCFALLCYCVNLSLRLDRVKAALPFARIDRPQTISVRTGGRR